MVPKPSVYVLLSHSVVYYDWLDASKNTSEYLHVVATGLRECWFVASTVIYMYMDLSRALSPICSASPEREGEGDIVPR